MGLREPSTTGCIAELINFLFTVAKEPVELIMHPVKQLFPHFSCAYWLNSDNEKTICKKMIQLTKLNQVLAKSLIEPKVCCSRYPGPRNPEECCYFFVAARVIY